MANAYQLTIQNLSLTRGTQDAAAKLLYVWLDTLSRYDGSPISGGAGYKQALLAKFDAQFDVVPEPHNAFYADARALLVREINRQ